MEGTALLVTVSEDLSNEPVLKVWALDKPEKKTGHPRCQTTVAINNGRRQFPVSSRGDLRTHIESMADHVMFRYLHLLLRLHCHLSRLGLLTARSH